MDPGTPIERCAICANLRQAGETWFVITENCSDGRLKIWKWNRQAAEENSAHLVCGLRHARELVIHWMVTGCLHYPFAAAPPLSHTVISSWNAASALPDFFPRSTAELCELAVDREAVLRAFRENPLSFNAILDELTIILENEAPEDTEAVAQSESAPWKI